MGEIKGNDIPLDAKPSELASRVDHQIWISGYIPSYNKDFLKKYSIKRIVRCFEDNGENRFPGIKYHVIPATDTATYKLDKHFGDAINFIADGIHKNEITLVHCHAGISRSATIVLAYLMCLGFHITDALKCLKHCRPFVCPNDGFMEQLVLWRYSYYGKKYCAMLLKELNKIKNNEEMSVKLPKINT